jgi:hypothetical protein
MQPSVTAGSGPFGGGRLWRSASLVTDWFHKGGTPPEKIGRATLLIVLESGRGLREQRFRTLRPRRRSRCVRGAAGKDRPVSILVADARDAAELQAAAGTRMAIDTSLATEAGHQPSGTGERSRSGGWSIL